MASIINIPPMTINIQQGVRSSQRYSNQIELLLNNNQRNL
ncbi:hypothetical protein pb186bvf_012283 [Paramecium bursaria]